MGGVGEGGGGEARATFEPIRDGPPVVPRAAHGLGAACCASRGAFGAEHLRDTFGTEHLRALSRHVRAVGRRVSHPRQIGALADKVCSRALARGAPWNVHTAHPRVALDGTCGATLVGARTVHVPPHASLECAFHRGARRTVHRRKYPKRTFHGARCTALTRHAQRWNVQRGPFAGAVLTTWKKKGGPT